MRLKYQLFITLLVASALLITLMYVISSWTFSRGFVSYINQSKAKRLEPVIEELASEYEKSGNWDRIVGDMRDWHELQRQFLGRGGPSQKQRKKPQPPSDKPPNGKRKRPDVPQVLLLADADKKILIGNNPSNRILRWVPITTDDNLLGYVAYFKLSRPEQQFDQLFEKQQKRSLGFAALAMVALSALLSIPLAARIVKPLLAVNQAVGEISKGRFSHRMDLSRRDEFGDLAANINRLGLTLEQNQSSRQRWIAEISHELRTPVAVLQSELEAIQDGVRDPTHAAIDSLHAEVSRLNRLIDDLHALSMSDIGALNYTMAPQVCADIVESFLQSQEQALHDTDLELKFERHTDAKLNADTHRLEQLLSNLLQNSIRYTDVGGTLAVSVSERNRQVIINWSDSTPGVSQEALGSLFEPLFRADQSRNRDTGGSGLGLAIAMKIVQAHGGTVEADHSPLGGLSIIIALPVYSGETQQQGIFT